MLRRTGWSLKQEGSEWSRPGWVVTMPEYCEFEVSLKHIKPRIWRRLLLPSSGSFNGLHHAIQDAFGWAGYHLWEFREPGRRGEPIAGVPDDSGWGPEAPPAARVKLASCFGGPGDRCLYVYDFGDDWEHEVKLRRVVADEERFRRRLLAGKRACPPEDCGSVPGYQRMAAFAKTGRDPYGDDDVDLAEWLGDWDPDRFDLEEAREKFDQ